MQVEVVLEHERTEETPPGAMVVVEVLVAFDIEVVEVDGEDMVEVLDVMVEVLEVPEEEQREVMLLHMVVEVGELAEELYDVDANE